MLSIKINRS